MLHVNFLRSTYFILAIKLHLITVYVYDFNRFYIICSNLMDLYWCTAMFFLTILYKDRAQTVAVWLSCTLVLYPFLLSTYMYYQDRMNSDYNLMCFNSILSHIDIDVSEEHAYPFTFERCSFHLRMNIVIFSGWLAPVRSTVNMSVFL